LKVLIAAVTIAMGKPIAKHKEIIEISPLLDEVAKVIPSLNTGSMPMAIPSQIVNKDTPKGRSGRKG
jgi:hypothetical protein